MVAESANRRPGFAVNTLWTWASVGANFVMAVFVTRLLIHRLGDEAYGLWAIVFGLVEYFTLFDFGIRAAVVKHVAEYSALGDNRRLAQTLHASFLYFLVVGLCLLIVTLVVAPNGVRFFPMSRDYQGTFTYMLLIAGCGWAVSTVFVWFAACLEAVQRFDLTYRIVIAMNVLRVAMFVTFLQLGYGLGELVTAAVAVRLLQCALLWRPFNRQFPQFRWALWDFDRTTFASMFRFGIHVVPSTIGWLLLDQGPGVVIGHVMQARFAGYYTVPRRLIQSVLDLVVRMGIVTTSRAAELAAHKDTQGLVRLGIQTNRYALVIFMPAAIFLGVYGDALFAVWLKPAYVTMSAPLLLVFVVGTIAAEASQFSSSSILYGMGKHQVFSWLVLIEAGISIAFIYYFATQENLLGAAIASTAVTVLNRGIVTPALICLELDYPVFRYVGAIMVRPLTVGAVAVLLTLAARETVLPGTRLREVALAAVLSSGLYVLLAARYCVFPEHQQQIVGLLRRRAPQLAAPVRLWFGVKE